MIIETIDIHGRERIVNVNFIAHIEYAVVERVRAHRGTSLDANPCSGRSGDQLIRLWMSTGQVIEISCDHDGDDVTEGVLRCYKSIMYNMKPENIA